MLKQGADFHFEISEVEITRVDCTSKSHLLKFLYRMLNIKLESTKSKTIAPEMALFSYEKLQYFLICPQKTYVVDTQKCLIEAL